MDLSSGPKAESPGQRHETRDDGGRETETGDSGPISYSGGPPPIKCKSTKEKEAQGSKKKRRLQHHELWRRKKERKQEKCYSQRPMSDVFKQATHEENGQESLNFFRPVRFPTALGGRGRKRFEMASSGKRRRMAR